ncbi:Uncharacterised protein [Mycoplasmopsis caviae]|nr:Uncharacterised protein [Mycoplasmopsis caviae]
MSNLQKYRSVETIINMEKAIFIKNKQEAFSDKYSTNNEASFRSKNFFTDKFKKVFNCLSNVSQLIIKNEFMKRNENKLWYEDYFSKSTYYKNRKIAIDEFLIYYLEYSNNRL